MNKSEKKSLKEKISLLPKRLQEEWSSIIKYYSKKPYTQIFEEFKETWNNFEGDAIMEFLDASVVVYELWKDWKHVNKYRVNFEFKYNSIKKTTCDCSITDKPSIRCDHQKIKKNFTQVWKEFKEEWGYGKEETKKMFIEMELLSERMLKEWKIKYKFLEPHIYEKDENEFSYIQKDFHLKSKVTLWKEFKEIWDIDVENYNENKYNNMVNYIQSVECDDTLYRNTYPRDFFEYREDSNYHSFDGYSVLEKYDICKEYVSFCDNYCSSSESDSD